MLERTWRALPWCIIWKIWRARNLAVHEILKPNVQKIVKEVGALLKEVLLIKNSGNSGNSQYILYTAAKGLDTLSLHSNDK